MTTLPRKQREEPIDVAVMKRAHQLFDWGFVTMGPYDTWARLTPKGWAALSSVAEPPMKKPVQRSP